MELRHLRYFIAVAELRSVRAASEQLHVTQPAISRQIQDPEDAIGAALFERTPRGLKFTAAGEAYLHEARECEYFSTPQCKPRRMVFEVSVLPLIEANQTRAVPDAGEEIVDGIRFLPMPGHSIGHMAIEIRSQGETALFSGDVMHSPLQAYRPQWNPTFCLHQEQARASRRWLLAHAVKTGATVFAAHFPETSAGMVREGHKGFEWRYLTEASESSGKPRFGQPAHAQSRHCE